MHTPRITALFLAALFCLAPFAAHAEYDLSQFTTGEHATGPKFSGKQIKGKVVVLEYWGITCGPCLQAIPHTTELAKKYGHDKLVVIANQVWGASNQRTADTWNERAKNNMVMVVNGGSLKGFRPRGVPSALIFDHTGKSIWEGHPGGMDRALAEAIANLPEPKEATEDKKVEKQEASGPAPIVKDLEADYFEVEVNRINAQNRNLLSTLDKLRRVADRATDQAQVEEAKTILGKVQSWAQAKQADMTKARKGDPATAYVLAEQLVVLFRGDELAAQAQAVIAETRKDRELFASVRATLLLRSVLAEAESIGLDQDTSAAEDKDNARSVRLITRDLQRLINEHPDTDAAQQAKALWSKWELGE